jgi:hypothetical protein
MTNTLMTKSVAACCEEDVRIVWTIKQKAEAAAFARVAKDCLRALGHIYGRSMTSGRFQHSQEMMTSEEFEASLGRHTASEAEKAFIRSQACAVMADEFYAANNLLAARRHYQACLDYDRWNPMANTKLAFLSLGKSGRRLRSAARSVRQARVLWRHHDPS